MNSPQRRSALWLAAVALAALAVSLLLAFASAPQRSGANGDGALRKTVERRSSPQARGTTAGAPIVAEPAKDGGGAVRNGPSLPLPSLADKPPLLWTLLAPWALAVDALAVLGMAAVLALRHDARRRRRARM